MGTVDIPVPHWGAAGSLRVTPWVDAGQGTLMPGKHPATLNKAITLLVPPGKLGALNFFAEIETARAYGVGGLSTESLRLRQEFRFQCSPEGDVVPHTRGQVSGSLDHNYDVIVAFKTWQDNHLGWPGPYLKTPAEIRVLHIEMSLHLNLTKAPGRLSVSHSKLENDVQASSPDKPGSEGRGSANLGSIVVELVQPVSKLQGLVHHVLFPINKDQIVNNDPEVKDQRTDFENFIRGSLRTYEVRVALDSGLLKIRGEARASATYKGSSAERSRYNQALSERRKKAVVDLLAGDVTTARQNLIEAIGDRMGKVGEEDAQQRRCEVSIKAADLISAVHQLWLSNRYLGR